MVKFFNSSTDYPFSWQNVTLALFNKYPNPHSAHVLSADVIDRHVENGILHTTRLLKKSSKVPKWGQYLLRFNEAYIIELSQVDLNTMTMTTTTRNLSHAKVMLIEEQNTIAVHPTNAKHTLISTKVR
jgi:PRELI-like family